MTRASNEAPATNAAPVAFGEDGLSARAATAAELLTARLDMMALAARMKLEGNLVPRALATCPQTEGGNTAECDSWPGLTAAPA